MQLNKEWKPLTSATFPSYQKPLRIGEKVRWHLRLKTGDYDSSNFVTQVHFLVIIIIVAVAELFFSNQALLTCLFVFLISMCLFLNCIPGIYTSDKQFKDLIFLALFPSIFHHSYKLCYPFASAAAFYGEESEKDQSSRFYSWTNWLTYHK